MLHTLMNPFAVIGFTIATVLISWLLLKKYSTLRYDIRIIKTLVVLFTLNLYQNWRKKTFVDFLEAVVKKPPNKPCILYEDESYTYLQVQQRSNQLVNVFRNERLVKRKDVACLFMYNEPAYVFCWFSLCKLGAIPSLVPVNLRGKDLLQCITVTKASTIICGKDSDLIEAIADILPDLQQQGIMSVLVYGASKQSFPDGFINLRPFLINSSDCAAPLELTDTDSAMYMFSSGTTGLPKPNRVSHRRVCDASYTLYVFGITSSDTTLYISQPFHHGLVFIIGLLSCLRLGGTVALRSKFSAVHFWADVRKFGANVIQYTNETCRYLLAQPMQRNDGEYPVPLNLAYGYGLRADMWLEFKNRFQIDRIGELWAEMEGNTGFSNTDGTVGAKGRYTPLTKVK